MNLKAVLFLSLFLRIVFSGTDETNPNQKLNILVTAPAIAYSFVAFQLELAEILAERGHNVVFAIHEVRPIPQMKSKIVEIINVHTSVANLEKESRHVIFDNIFNNRSGLDATAMKAHGILFARACHETLENEEYVSNLRTKKFDVAIAGEHDLCGLPLFEKLGIEAVMMATPMTLTDLVENALGIPIPKSYNTLAFAGAINSPELTFRQRLSNVYLDFVNNFGGGFHVFEAFQKMLDTNYGHNTYSLRNLLKNVDLYFVNAHDLIDFPRPKSSKIVNVGTIAVKKPKQLSTELQKIFDSSKKGVILFSWGSQIDLSTLPKNLKLNLFNAFAQFPDFEFVLKYTKNLAESADLIDEYPNLHPFEWLDQTTILAQNRTAALITHGGRNSMFEALMYGVPAICVPMFGDQQANAGIYRHKKFGIPMQIQDLSQHTVVKSLELILFDPEFKQNIETLKQKIVDYPYDPRHQFIIWVEYVAKFKEIKEFDLYGAQMDVIRHNNLDVYASICIFGIFIFIGIKFVLRILLVFSKHFADQNQTDKIKLQ